MSINPLELTFYQYTGYSPNDEPASDAVINANAHFVMAIEIKEYEPIKLTQIKVSLSDAQIEPSDYLKITDTVTGARWYYYIVNHVRINEKVVVLQIRLDAFATVGLGNISFYGNITRRTLSADERENYPLLPEPWAPRRPLRTRRLILDFNTNKQARIPAHIDTVFEEGVTAIEKTETINVPDTPAGIPTTEDSLSISANLPYGYPNIAADTAHTITTPWGSITYTTPMESYYGMNTSEVSTFLRTAKKFNALDLIEAPYYLPSPGSEQTFAISEFSGSQAVNKKAYKYYTAVTIRSLASNQSRTYSDNDTDLQASQNLAVIIVPDKNGGIYVMPSTIRDTGLNAYTYLDGVYSPFESILLNAVGDTPAKFAADGTTLLNQALNDLFLTYAEKINAMQLEGMQTKYFKDLGNLKSMAMAFYAEVLGYTSTAILQMPSLTQSTTGSTNIPSITQSQDSTQRTPSYTQTQKGTTTTNAYTVIDKRYIPIYNQVQNIYQAATSDTQTHITGCIQIQGHYENTTINYPGTSQNQTTNITVPSITTTINSTTTTPKYTQCISQTTQTGSYNSTTTTTVPGVQRQISKGVEIAENGVSDVYDGIETIAEAAGTDAWEKLKTIIFRGYRNEIHSFMLGNINDYLNRWVSIQNDLHNGRVANLFKNVTLLGTYQDYNKFAGKYEILVTSLQPEDEANFDLFLSHFGHAVDEYSNTLVTNAAENYNYTMVGEDAILTNTIMPQLSAQILDQFRAGVRVWNTKISASNY